MTSHQPQPRPAPATIPAGTRPALPEHRWLVIGARGQLGQELIHLFAEHGLSGAGADTQRDVVGVDLGDIDITDAADTTAVIGRWLEAGDDRRPVVLNAAAYTAVDDAESDEATAWRVNADGPRNIAEAIDGRARLIHISTDYVFAGDARTPYRPDDEPAPRTAYGRTKVAGDRAVRETAPDTGYVVRTAWVYGAYGPNFVKTMAKLSRDRDRLQVVADQVGSPTWTRHLAQGLLELAVSEAPAGFYNRTGGGQCSWFEFAQAIFAELGLDPARVEPTTSEAFVRPAPRPAYSVLSAQEWAAAGLTPAPHWRDALREAFERDGAALRTEG